MESLIEPGKIIEIGSPEGGEGMEEIDKITLEQVVYRRAYENAKILEISEWMSRFEEGRWLLKLFIEKLEKIEKLEI